MKNKISAKKISLTAAILLVVVFFTCILSACDLFATPSAPVDNRPNLKKPDLSEAGSDFHAQTKKGSKYDGSVKLSLFRLNNGVTMPTSTEQKILFKRTSIDNQFLLNGSIFTGEGGDIFASFYQSVRAVLDKKYDSNDDPIYEYLSGESELQFSFGYDSCYNLSIDYISDSFGSSKFFSAEKSTVNEVTSTINEDFLLSDHFLSSGILDLKSATDWVNSDSAGKYFSTENDMFIYNLDVNEEKIATIILEKLESLIPALSELNVDKETFGEVFDIAKDWVTVTSSSVDALVTEKGMPHKTESTLDIDINVNLSDLDNVLFLLLGKELKDEVSLLIRAAVMGNKLCGTKGENNTIGFRVEYSSTEEFFHGKECSFDGAKADIFADIDEEIKDRTVISAEDIKSVWQKIVDLFTKKEQQNG